MNLNNIIDTITFSLMKFVNKLLALKTDSYPEEEIPLLGLDDEHHEEHHEEEKEEPFFNNKTIFDDLSSIESSLAPVKQFCKEKYEYFKEKYDALEKKAYTFYESKCKEKELVCHLTVNVSIDPNVEMHGEIKKLADEITEYKKQELNYQVISNRLINLNESLTELYKRLIAGVDKKLLNSATDAFDRISRDASNMEFDENTVEQEKICKLFCQAAYTLHKCNMISGIDDPLDLNEKERGIIFSVFQKNVEELLDLIEIFNYKKKYYTPLKSFLKNLTMKTVHDDFLKKEEFLNFVKNEKKVYELAFHYKNKKEEKEKDVLEILKIKEYFTGLSLKYPGNHRLKFFVTMLNESFNFDLSYFEVYNLIYVFGLKTFSKNHLKNVSENDETDLIKILYESNFPEPNLNKASSTDYVVVYQNANVDEVKKVVKKFESLKLEYKADENNVQLNKAYFVSCNNILKNLSTTKSY